jgi:hypothetical protein
MGRALHRPGALAEAELIHTDEQKVIQPVVTRISELTQTTWWWSHL